VLISPRAIVSVAILFAATAATAEGAEIEGVEFADRRRAGDTQLILHGTGLLRYKIVFKGYVAGLYLGEGVSPESVLSDAPRRLGISYFWSIDAEDFAEATRDGIARNVDAATYESLRERIDEINGLYEDVEPGDRYALTYLPGRGTVLSKNDVAMGSIGGADFASALFSIWLGKEPLDRGLRDQLLDRR
jgi:hypothetical protein